MSGLASIRVATISDLEHLFQMERACEGAPHWSEATWRSMLQDEHAPNWHSILMAEKSATVVGFVALSGAGNLAELESVVVSPATRSQGVGRALCVAAMHAAYERGAASLELEVRSASYLPRVLYASLGFLEQGIRKGYYRDPEDDAVLMSLALPTPENQLRKV